MRRERWATTPSCEEVWPLEMASIVAFRSSRAVRGVDTDWKLARRFSKAAAGSGEDWTWANASVTFGFAMVSLIAFFSSFFFLRVIQSMA